jgi:hypothetical protein
MVLHTTRRGAYRVPPCRIYKDTLKINGLVRAPSRFEYSQNSSSNNKIRPSAFSFQAKGKKKKLAKRNAKKEISMSADIEESSAPSTAQAFEKA